MVYYYGFHKVWLVVTETLANSTNSTTGAHNPENLTFSPLTHPQEGTPK
jgi:hypothetical protein